MRRLPVFFVLDCSESMVGENLNRMEGALQTVVRGLRTNPHALETVHLSVIAFAGIARTIVPLLEAVSFYPPRLPLGGGTSLGAALDVLMTDMDRALVRTTPERKGDWKPIVYLFTDGRPTDDPRPAIARWNVHYARRATLIAVGFGQNVDFSILKQLTEQTLSFEGTQEDDFNRFIQWLSTSIAAHSKSVGEGIDNPAPAVLDERVMKLVKEPAPALVDEACVTLVGRCQQTRRPYLIKYDREFQEAANLDFKLQIPVYRLTGCYPMTEEYFAWSDSRATDPKINTANLLGAPGCPHCGNATAFAMCGCGKLMCINGPEEAICPWCEETVRFAPGRVGEDGGFEVGRGRG